jgi:hypothetical protein
VLFLFPRCLARQRIDAVRFSPSLGTASRPATWASASPAKKSRRDRRDNTRTGGRKPGPHGLQRARLACAGSGLSDIPPFGPITWRCGGPSPSPRCGIRRWRESSAFRDAIPRASAAATEQGLLRLVTYLSGYGLQQYFPVGYAKFAGTLVPISSDGRILPIASEPGPGQKGQIISFT